MCCQQKPTALRSPGSRVSGGCLAGAAGCSSVRCPWARGLPAASSLPLLQRVQPGHAGQITGRSDVCGGQEAPLRRVRRPNPRQSTGSADPLSSPPALQRHRRDVGSRTICEFTFCLSPLHCPGDGRGHSRPREPLEHEPPRAGPRLLLAGPLPAAALGHQEVAFSPPLLVSPEAPRGSHVQQPLQPDVQGSQRPGPPSLPFKTGHTEETPKSHRL